MSNPCHFRQNMMKKFKYSQYSYWFIVGIEDPYAFQLSF